MSTLETTVVCLSLIFMICMWLYCYFKIQSFELENEKLKRSIAENKLSLELITVDCILEKIGKDAIDRMSGKKKKYDHAAEGQMNMVDKSFDPIFPTNPQGPV